MATTETRTETRTHVEVATEEVELHECPGCGQFVEDSELMPVLVNVEPERIDKLGGAILENHSRVCCRYCAQSWWDFDPEETDRIDHVLERGRRVRSTGWAWLSALAPSAQTLGLLIGLGVTVLIAVTVFDQMMNAIDPAAFEQAEPSPDFGTAPPFLEFLPVFLVGLVIMAMLTKMPRV